MVSDQIDKLRAAVRDVPDFPKPGIIFKDITPILANGALFRALFPGKLDDFRSPFLGLHVAVRAEAAIIQSIGGLITFRAEH